MFFDRRKTLGLVGVTAMASAAIAVPVVGVAGAADAPVATAAKSHTVKIIAADGKVNGTKLSATLSGTFGKGTSTGKLVIPSTLQNWKFKGGVLKVKGTASTGAADVSKGKWTVTGGTGKFKGAKGGGTFAGKQSTAKFTYHGKVSF